MGQPKPTRFVKVCSRRQWQITFCAFRRPESRPQGGGGLSTAFHAKPISWPAVASGRRPRRGKCLLGAVETRRLGEHY
jgi:hypothetical protein